MSPGRPHVGCCYLKNKEMKALVKTAVGQNHVELAEWPEPYPAPDEIKLKIAAAGICGTDLHILKGAWPCQIPVVIGHEFCGIVVDVGSQVKGFKPGDRVVGSNPARTCGSCYHCRAGNPFMCPSRVSAGYMIDGAFADYFCICAQQCHLLPSQVSWRQATLGEPLAVAVRAVMERTRPQAGDCVLVSGPGPLGLLTMQLAKQAGAKVIIAGIDKDQRRLAIAQELGADEALDSSRQDLRTVVSQLTCGTGADCIYECAGTAASFELCVDVLRPGGTMVQLGIVPDTPAVNLAKITCKELSVIGSYGYVWSSWRRTIQLLAQGKLKTEELISHEFPLAGFQQAFRAAEDGSAVKVIFNPQVD